MTRQREDLTTPSRPERPVEPVLYAAREKAAHHDGSPLASDGPQPGPKPTGLEWAADD